MGGYSSERDISLKSGKAVVEALRSEGCEVVPIDIVDKEDQKISQYIAQYNVDVAFIALHGCLGEDGKIQSILEKLDLPFTGPGVKASALAFNKIATQSLLKKNGISVAEHIALTKTDAQDVAVVIEKKLGFPVIIKPPCEGSSIGISIVTECSQIGPAMDLAWKYAPDILVERYINGRELTVGILGNEALPIVEIIHNQSFFNFAAKYQMSTTRYVVPAQLEVCVSQDIRQTALKVHQVLGCQDLSRVDFILGEDKRFYVLEVNTIPGFTSSSLLPKAAAQNGIGFSQLCLKLVTLAYGKKKTNQNTASRS